MPPNVDGTVQELATDTVAASVATKLGMGGGTATSLFGWLSGNNIVILVGVLTTLLGFIINYYYQKKRDNREMIEHQIRIKEANAEERRREEYHQSRLTALRDGCEL